MTRIGFLAMTLGCLIQPALAATQREAEAALAAARAEEAKAVAVQAAWTPTEAMLSDARKALAGKQWDAAKAAADEALALAKRSLAQSEEQKTAWRNAVIR
jgi:hypothetical protein